MKKLLEIISLVVIAMLYTMNVHAEDISCGIDPQYPYTEVTIPINASVYAGEDIPVGTTLYKVNVSNTSVNVGVECQTRKSWSINTYKRVLTEPMGAPYDFAGNTYNGQVYPTNIMGVGVAIYTASGQPTMTISTPVLDVRNYDCQNACDVSGTSSKRWHSNFYIAFVKTGTIASGSSILGNSIPQVIYTAEETPGLTGLPLTLRKINFAGSVVVQTSTCQAKNKTVELGEYELRSTFRGKGSVTPWKDSSIELINCPAFIGYYSSAQQSLDGGAPVYGTPTSNKLLVSITANTGVIDAEAGLISINKTQSGAASGIAIQLGWGDKSNPSTWDITGKKSVTPPSDGSKNITIPMAARYYQTDNVVSPGRADGQVMFTIEYN